jgi:hypothetical protein
MEQTGQLFRWGHSAEDSVLLRRAHLEERDRGANIENTLHMLRDADPYIYVHDSIVRGSDKYAYGDLILNMPETAYVRKVGEKPNTNAPIFAPIELSDEEPLLDLLGPEDLIISTTRPTVPPRSQMGRRRYGRSKSELEKAIQSTYRAAFSRCNRDEVELNEYVVDKLEDTPLYPYYNMKFEAHNGARCTEMGGEGQKGDLFSVGYVAYTPRISERIKSGVLTIFGIDGTSTLLWCYVVSRKYRNRLLSIIERREPRLWVGTFRVGFPETRIHRLSELQFTNCEIPIDVAVV